MQASARQISFTDVNVLIYLKTNMKKTVKEMFDLKGRVAIVTAVRGIGKMAEGLAEAGASVMLCARRSECWMKRRLNLRWFRRCRDDL